MEGSTKMTEWRPDMTDEEIEAKLAKGPTPDPAIFTTPEEIAAYERAHKQVYEALRTRREYFRSLQTKKP
jgi:hypothetical protein